MPTFIPLLIAMLPDSSFLPANLSGWAAIIGLLIAALWTLWTFNHARKLKTAEIVLKIEDEYRRHIDLLLQLEIDETYNQHFRPAIIKQAKLHAEKLNAIETQNINRLETVLRFLFMCSQLRKLGVSAYYIDALHAWYLRLLVKKDREELRIYMEKFWPALYFWAFLVCRPWPVKVLTYLSQARPRSRCWWYGSDNFEKRQIVGYIEREQPTPPPPSATARRGS